MPSFYVTSRGKSFKYDTKFGFYAINRQRMDPSTPHIYLVSRLLPTCKFGDADSETYAVLLAWELSEIESTSMRRKYSLSYREVDE